MHGCLSHLRLDPWHKAPFDRSVRLYLMPQTKPTMLEGWTSKRRRPSQMVGHPGNRARRLYATTAIPIRAHRFQRSLAPTRVLSWNFGIVSRLTWRHVRRATRASLG